MLFSDSEEEGSDLLLTHQDIGQQSQMAKKGWRTEVPKEMIQELRLNNVRVEARSEQEEMCIDDMLLGDTENLRDDLESSNSSPSDLKQCRSMMSNFQFTSETMNITSNSIIGIPTQSQPENQQ